MAEDHWSACLGCMLLVVLFKITLFFANCWYFV